MLGILGSLPQLLLAILLLLQGRGLSGSDAEMQSELGLFAAAVFIFWSRVAGRLSGAACWLSGAARGRWPSPWRGEHRLDSF